MKYLCGRKGKYGLNFQAICDADRRFLDISLIFGAAASDLLSFEASPLRLKLEKEGFLTPGLCIFGDNAYVNRFFMATPYPNVAGDTEKDAYNFFHSQLRINIECAFGILVMRWGFLRKKAPSRYSVKKTIATVSCLCRLHNFLIDHGDSKPPTRGTPRDELTMAIENGVSVQRQAIEGETVDAAGALTGGGEHFDDDPRSRIRDTLRAEDRARVTQRYGADTLLPRESMFVHVTNRGLRRPAHNVSRNRNR